MAKIPMTAIHRIERKEGRKNVVVPAGESFFADSTEEAEELISMKAAEFGEQEIMEPKKRARKANSTKAAAKPDPEKTEEKTEATTTDEQSDEDGDTNSEAEGGADADSDDNDDMLD